MAVRIKTIPNGIQGENKPERHVTTHRPPKASDASGQVNKILELEWEALGRKLNKPHHDGARDKLRDAELEKLRKQLRDKDEALKRANHRIATLEKQLYPRKENQPAHGHQQSGRFKGPVQGRK